MTLELLISHAAERGASDLFLKVGSKPAIKGNGQIQSCDGPLITEADARRLACERMTAEQANQFDRDHEMNLSFTVPGVARIRQNVYRQRDTIATTCRLIPLRAKT